MYSRSARRESTPNKTSDPARPISSVSAKIAHIFHQARVLAFRLSIVARAASLFAVRLSTTPYHARQNENAQHATKEPCKLWVFVEKWHYFDPPRRNSHTAPCARSRNASL